MARIKGKDTKPELIVRQVLHALGYRFRLHRRDLPGRPDIVLPRHRTVVLVHGCFWHRHEGCARASMPATGQDFWQAKFDRTVTRDREQVELLTAAGWKVAVVWECEIKDRASLSERFSREMKREPGSGATVRTPDGKNRIRQSPDERHSG